ncbi:MAG: hypothetical protein WCH07_08490 [Deltaproteobacteria bacterium]
MKEMGAMINVNLKIIPFGCASIELKEHEKVMEVERKESPVYIQLKTTNPGLVQIGCNGDNYIVPKTTNRFL